MTTETNWPLKGAIAENGGNRIVAEKLREYGLRLSELDISKIIHGRRRMTSLEKIRFAKILDRRPEELFN